MGFISFFMIFAMLAMAAIAESANSTWTSSSSSLTKSCVDGGDCIGDLFDEMEGLMDSETNRRQLRGRGRRYISYGAMRRNNVPCNRRGHSYYNCRKRHRANPYRRGCNAITRCHRFTS